MDHLTSTYLRIALKREAIYRNNITLKIPITQYLLLIAWKHLNPTKQITMDSLQVNIACVL